MGALADTLFSLQNNRWLAVSTILPLAAVLLGRSFFQSIVLRWRLRSLPLINSWGFSPSDRAKKLQAFLFNADGLIREGFTKSKKAFRLATDNGEVVILPPELTAEIRNDDRFSFTHLLEQDFLGHVPAFRNFNPKRSLNDMAVDVIQGKLTPSLGLVTKDLSQEGTKVFQEEWGDSKEWHAISVKNTLLQVVARLSARVFLGPELCRNPEWLSITVSYTVNLFFGVEALKKYPRILHPIIWRFVPQAKAVYDQINEAERLIKPVVEKRTAELELERLSSSDNKKIQRRPTTYTDAIHWANEVGIASRRHYDPYLLQLGFSLAAIHTTTDHLTQALFDLCAHPEYVQPLREELIQVLREEGGMTKQGLFKLKLMDSFMKESQRFKPTMSVQMRRILLEDVTLSNGVFLPKGVQVAIPVDAHFSPESYGPDPQKFDGYRYLRWADDPEKEKFRHFVSTSPDHMGFGHGKHACPGRFFAANEIKIAFCHILSKYDFKFAEGQPGPQVFKMGWVLSSDPMAQMLVRRREGGKEVEELEKLLDA